MVRALALLLSLAVPCFGQLHSGTVTGLAFDPITPQSQFLHWFRVGQQDLINENVPFGTLDSMLRVFPVSGLGADTPVLLSIAGGVDGTDVFHVDLAGVSEISLAIENVTAADRILSRRLPSVVCP
jgi:hypothetical protein